MGAAENIRETAFRVVISDDQIEAFVVADAAFEGGRQELVAFLEAQGLAGPPDEQGIATFLDDKPIGVAVRVVMGRRPVPGFEARIDYVFASLAPKAAPGEVVPGGDPFAIDHRETRALEKCAVGDILVRKAGGCEAVDGVDAYGRPMPAERGKDVKLVAGSNATLSADGSNISAAIDGVPSRDPTGRIVVNPSVTVKNVDFKSGNIHFEGSVVVEGDVFQGFCVEACGDVFVKGSVENATIRAGGTIHVGGGVRRHSNLRAAGDIEVRFADSECHLEARGAVRVAQNAIQCDLIGDAGVAVGGQLVSGRAQSWNHIEVGVLGCPQGSQTVVNVERPTGALRVQALREELGLAPPAQDENGLGHPPSSRRPTSNSMVVRAGVPIGHTTAPPSRTPTRGPLPGSLSRLPTPGLVARPPPPKSAALRPAPTGAKEVVKSRVTTLIERRELEKLLEHAERALAAPTTSHGRVVAKTSVRAGVTLSIAHDVLSIDTPLGPRAFFVSEGAIVETPLAPAAQSSPRAAK